MDQANHHCELKTLTLKVISFILIAFFCSTAEAQVSKRALFLGNSYTNYNNLPALTASIAQSAGDTLVVASNTPGGYTFDGHLNNQTSLNLIAQGNWDFVVLQQQSQMPAFPLTQVEVETFPFATQLNDSILAYSPCAETVFYMTWGRENGDQQNCANWPPVCTYEGMDDLLRERYMMMAEMNEGIVSPVGTVWRYLRENHPDIDLFSSDGSHPSAAGSYVAAVCFYSTFFRKSPLNALYDYTVDNAQEATIRQVVHDLVYTQAANWFVGAWDPAANFTLASVDEDDFIITNNSMQADEFFYSIDGINWIELNETTTALSLNEPGNYTISLIAHRCGLSDTTTQTLQVSPSLVPFHNTSGMNIFPNPTNDFITIKLPKSLACKNIQILNSVGELVLHEEATNTESFTVDCSTLPAGIYTLQATTNHGLLVKQVQIQ